MTVGLWLCLFTFVIVFFPYLSTLKKFEQERVSFFGEERFAAFQIIDILWIVICFGILGRSIDSVNDYSEAFSLLAMLLALATVPTAIYSAFTGIYLERTRFGYSCFRRYKDPAQQFLRSAKYPELKVVGLVQSFILMVIIGVSTTYIF